MSAALGQHDGAITQSFPCIDEVVGRLPVKSRSLRLARTLHGPGQELLGSGRNIGA